MRIIGGRYGGARLFTPKGHDARPTSERAREALFNIIGPRIDSARFLDLYGGTGAVGLEALSRGAEHVTVVEIKHVDLVARNSAKLKIDSSREFEVIQADALYTLKELALRGELFDLIFADPPWKDGAEKNIVELAANLLKSAGWLILETYYKTDPPLFEPRLKIVDSRRYGDTALLFYERSTTA
ncbi:16S rRNA (guanine(966)-N(2))-methyltransferase [hydrothermal vent metagenome]|uniref:16S rRNA (Guanine(966)-N(2))-methyltransferase n=1 Tax=hydrothermal vent metagenome TaxID=652676 RepID=A0A3B1C393_9ZZZZ